jgi:hypothetical protein
MLKKRNSGNTLFKTIIHYGESDKDRYIQTLSFHELKQIKNVHGTDIEQRKELKKQTRINKEPNFTTEY